MTTRNKLITALKPYFNIRELVCKDVYNKFKDRAWQFLSTELLSTLLILRTIVLKEPMIVNNWHKGGSYSQRGFRCNTCSLVSDKETCYLSAHQLGKGVDFNVPTKTAEEVRKLIKENIDKFEYPIRLEEGTSWVHVDCYTTDDSIKLVTFKA